MISGGVARRTKMFYERHHYIRNEAEVGDGKIALVMNGDFGTLHATKKRPL